HHSGARFAGRTARALGRRALFDLVGAKAQEAELRAHLAVRGDEGAPALAANHEVRGGEFVDCLAHGALADAVARGELGLARDRLARLPLARLQPAQQQLADLPVQRCERRPGLGRPGRAAVSLRCPGHLVHDVDSTTARPKSPVSYVLYKISLRLDTTAPAS